MFQKVRIFSAWIKDIEPKPTPTPWGAKMPLGQLMTEFSNSTGGGKKDLVTLFILIHVSSLQSYSGIYFKAVGENTNLIENTFLLNVSYPLVGGWVHSVSFSADGNRVCWVGHDSSLTVADASKEMSKTQLKTQYLPFTAVSWVSLNSLVAVVSYMNFVFVFLHFFIAMKNIKL